MKKILFSLVCMVAVLQLSAQQPNISNPSFEQWTGSTANGWTTSISGSITGVPILGSYPLSFNFGTKVQDAHAGYYKNPLTHRQEVFEVEPPKDFLTAWKELK